MPPKKKAAAAAAAATTAQPPVKRRRKDVFEDDSPQDSQGDDAGSAAPPPPIPSEPSAPIQHSYTWASSVASECSKLDPCNPSVKVPCALGVDEAGRGPVLGPLVYGVAYCPVAYQDSLRAIGFADSKALTAERRDQLLTALVEHGDHLGWAVRVMSPQDISAGMLRRRPTNLNAQSSQATVGLIAGVLAAGVDLTEIYVDTVGDPKSYARLLSSHFPRHPHIKWTVTSKADAIYPIVGAASIAAKVTRDRCIDNWKYAEQPQLHVAQQHASVLSDTTNHPTSVTSGEEKEEDKQAVDGGGDDVWERMGALGSGYPGDPNTVAFLKRTLDPVFGWPGIVRFSWATAKTMLEEKVKPTTRAVKSTPPSEPTLGGKRLTRSISRTSSLADAAPALDDDSQAVAEPRPVSLYGTPLPQPSIPGGSAPRAYTVRWIDEPVAISKFFGSAPAKSKSSSHTAVAQSMSLQAQVDDWLKREPQWRSKRQPPATTPPLQLNASKLIKDLGLASADATFSLF